MGEKEKEKDKDKDRRKSRSRDRRKDKDRNSSRSSHSSQSGSSGSERNSSRSDSGDRASRKVIWPIAVAKDKRSFLLLPPLVHFLDLGTVTIGASGGHRDLIAPPAAAPAQVP